LHCSISTQSRKTNKATISVRDRRSASHDELTEYWLSTHILPSVPNIASSVRPFLDHTPTSPRIFVSHLNMKTSLPLSYLWPLALQPSLSLAYWRMACSVSQTARVDLILSPGEVSGHVHKFAGGSSKWSLLTGE